MKWFYILLAGLMAVSNIRRARPFRRWTMAAFWIGFGAMALMPRPKLGDVPFAFLFLGLLLVNEWKLLYFLALAGPRLTTLLAGLFFRRRIKAIADLFHRLTLWMACSLRGRPLLVAYRGPSTLSDLIEAHLLPRVARRAIIIKNWSPQERHRFSVLDRMAVMSLGDLHRLPLIVRFRPISAPRRFDPRKALWLSLNGRPETLDQLVSAALRVPHLTARGR